MCKFIMNMVSSRENVLFACPQWTLAKDVLQSPHITFWGYALVP